MERRYRLPISAMVEVMKMSAEQVVLHTQLSALPGVCKKACQIQVVLGQGGLFSCCVTDMSGRTLLQQQKAYKALLSCGDLEWDVTPLPTWTSSEPVQSVDHHILAQEQNPRSDALSSSIPTLRVSPLPAETLATFAHPYRMVLSLVDGQRSIYEIARLLSRSPAAIQQMLASVPHLVHLFTHS